MQALLAVLVLYLGHRKHVQALVQLFQRQLVADQSAVRVFAEKAAGYGIPGITIDGTDPDAIAAAFTWAAERARAGEGPTLIELVCMRICGHAHHDDMLYLGREPQVSRSYPPLFDGGYADRALYEFWRGRDPIPTYAARLEAEGVIAGGDLDRLWSEAEEPPTA